MLSRHFRAHNLNVPEMRLLFSLRCADPGIFVRGGEGEAQLPKNNRNNIIFKPQLILQFYRGGGGPAFFRGVQLFPGGGGGPDAYFHKDAYNLWFFFIMFFFLLLSMV